MAIKIPIPAKDLSAVQLVEIFHLFCKAYDIKPHEDDDWYFRNEGIQKVNSGFSVDYRPFMGAKFFAVGWKDYIEVWGYTSDEPQPNRMKKLRKSIADYLNENPEQ